jgi:glyoxylase-like metal-dependent hydrolase (beta-lactamase superfamily II)
LIDAGLGDQATQTVWENLLAGVLERPLTRIIVTHFHPDHVGLAGWIAQRADVPVYMSETEYLMSMNIQLNPGALEAEHYVKFYLDHGLDPEETQRLVTKGHSYLRNVRPLPLTFRSVIAGDELLIGKRKFQIFTGGGHSPEQVYLYCEAERIFFSADQVLKRISPNVSVSAIDPDGDPLGQYLRSLAAISASIPDDVLVLPGHEMPFYGLHDRVAELIAHHELRCNIIEKACRGTPKTAAELVPEIFHRAFGPHEMGFAFSEVLSHINYMLRRGRLRAIAEKGKPVQVTSALV